MSQRLRSYVRQNHLALLALMIAVAGVPTAWAIGRNTVGAPQIKKNAVGLSEHKDNSVGSKEVINSSLLSEDFASGQLPAGQGQQGPQGPQGEQGLEGPPGEDLTDSCEGNDPLDVMMRAGTVCIDKYEASVWTQANGGTQLITEAQIDGACPNNGQPTVGAPCTAFFARSVAGVEPARSVTWFQALAALANSGKRLPTNAEWQTAVSGTPDTGGADNGTTNCNTDPPGGVISTGSRADCVSDWGVFDMVGNVWEWVADWDEQADSCANYGAGEFGTDLICFGDGTPSRFPGALVRGGGHGNNLSTGPFAVDARTLPSGSNADTGFRGAR